MALLPRRIALAALLTVGIAGLQPVLAATAATSSVPAPVLTGPASNTTTPLKSVILTWNSVPGASQYQVQVSPNGEWTNNTVTLPGSGDTVNDLYEMPLSLPHGDYFWHVRAEVGGVWGSYSAADQFEREWYVPITMLQTPANSVDADHPGDPSLSWVPVTDASEYLVRFSSSPEFPSDKTKNCFTNSTSFTPYELTSATEVANATCFDVSDLINDTTYYWELEALDDSSAAPLTADTVNDPNWDCAQAQPECDAAQSFGSFDFWAPKAGSPTDTVVTGQAASWHTTSLTGTDCTVSATCPMTPTFSWTPVAGANYYEVHVYRDIDKSNTYRAYTTAYPELTPRDSYFDAQAGTSYYWTVAAGTCQLSASNLTCAQPPTGSGGSSADCAAGSTPGSSDPTLDTTDSAISATPHGAEGAQSVQGGGSSTVTLTGTNLESGLCIAPSEGSASNVNVVSPTTVTFTYAAPTTGGAATFVAVNPDGAATGDSATLTIDAGDETRIYAASGTAAFNKASGPITTTSPLDNATVHGGALTFKWSDFMATAGDGAYDARNYELQVSKDVTFDSNALDVKDIDLTQYTDPKGPLANGTYYWRVAAIDESGNVLTWSATKTVTLDVTKPTIKFSSSNGVSLTGPIEIKLSEALSGVSSSTVLVKAAGAKSAVAGKLTAGSSSATYEFTPTKPLIPGETYNLSVTAAVTDSFGNPVIVTGTTVRATKVAKDTSKAWTYSGGWKRHSASGARSGSYESAAKGQTASISLVGGTATLYACTGPSMGTIKVTTNGHTTKVSEHKSFTRCGEAVWSGALGSGVQKLSVKVFRGSGNVDEVSVS